MSFIRISNESDGVNRLFLEKLGLSTKRDDANTIGQFGSGSKFAPISALRNGIRWVNVGFDDLGDYMMEYIVVKEGSINSIYYLYDESDLKPSSFVAEAGMMSWDDASFQIFREAFANALDENISSGKEYSIDVVDQIKHEPGVFAVYITATKELLDVVKHFDEYFCINREKKFSSSRASIYLPVNGQTHVYCKGVLVHEGHSFDKQYPPIFDYEFNDVTLNEERRIRSESQIYDRINGILASSSRDFGSGLEIWRRIMDHIHLSKMETMLIPSYYAEYISWGSNPREAFCEKFGKNACIYTPEEKKFKFAAEIHNMVAVEIKSDYFFKILENSGVPTIRQLLGDEVDFNFVELSGKNKEMFDKAYEIVARHEPEIYGVGDIKFYIPTESQDSILGVAKGSNVYLSMRCFTGVEAIVRTLLHEIDHVISGYDDSDTRFRALADVRIANLIMRIEKLEGRE